MAKKNLSQILKQFLALNVLSPLILLLILVSFYLLWQQMDQMKTQSRILCKGIAQNLQIYLENSGAELKKFADLLPEKSKEKDFTFLQYLYFHSKFKRIVLIDPEGQVVYTLPGMNRRYQELDEIFAPRQLKNDFQIQVSDAYFSKISGKLSLALLLASPDGMRLVGELNLEEIDKICQGAALPKNREAFVIETSGKYFLSPWKKEIKEIETAAELDKIVDQLRHQEIDYRILYMDQAYKMFNFNLVPISGWTVAVSIPASSIFSPIFKYLAVFAGLLFLGFILSIAYINRKVEQEVSEPFDGLRKYIGSLKQGDFSVLEPKEVLDPQFAELQELKEEFSNMSQSLALREASLKQRNLEQRILLDNVPMQIWYLIEPDFQGAVNQARADFLGKDIEEASYKNYFEVMPKKMAERTVASNEQVFEQKRLIRYEESFQNAQGEERILAIIKTPQLNALGEVEFVICIAEDVTEKKQYQDRLRQLSTAVEQSPASILITDANGWIEYVNPTFCRLTGYEFSEVMGKNPKILKSGRMSKEHYQELWQTITSGQVWRGEFLNRKKDKELYWESASIAPILDEQGRITHYVAVKEDISAKKKAEQALLQAKLEAESANKAKSEFLANISHEVRTPMNGIVGMISLLLETELSQEQAEFAKTLQSSANSMLEVINHVLDFSRLESGKMETELLNFELRPLLESLVDLHTLAAQEKGVELYYLVKKDVPNALIGDPLRLKQVLNNLLSNAIKFTSEGWIKLEISINQEAGKNYIFFQVKDTGIGIDKKKQEHIFEPFVQADGSTTRRFGGTGLGLSLGKQLIEMMGGKMGVHSNPNKGAKFWFTLPLRKQQREKPLVPEQDQKAFASYRIAFADKDQISRQIAEKLLQGMGFRSDSMDTAESLLSKVIEADEIGEPYSAVILAEGLINSAPENLVQVLKQRPEFSNERIILLLNLNRSFDLSKYSDLRIEEFLTKPVKESRLHKTLGRLLGVRASDKKRFELGNGQNKEEIPRPDFGKILLAEDNPVNQGIAKSMLQKIGFDVEIAANGRDILQRFSRSEFRLILMDIQMPIMDGLEAAAAWRQQESEAGVSSEERVPILALTAHSLEDSFPERLEQAGIDDLIVKPLKIKELYEKINAWVLNNPGSKACLPEEFQKSASKKVFAYDRVLYNMQGDKEILKTLVQAYEEDTEKTIRELGKTIKDKDFIQGVSLAHELKGASANIGAFSLQSKAKMLLEKLKIKDLDKCENILQDIIIEFDKFKEEKKNYFFS